MLPVRLRKKMTLLPGFGE